MRDRWPRLRTHEGTRKRSERRDDDGARASVIIPRSLEVDNDIRCRTQPVASQRINGQSCAVPIPRHTFDKMNNRDFCKDDPLAADERDRSDFVKKLVHRPIELGRVPPTPVERALLNATTSLEQASTGESPEVQATTGPGNLTNLYAKCSPMSAAQRKRCSLFATGR